MPPGADNRPPPRVPQLPVTPPPIAVMPPVGFDDRFPSPDEHDDGGERASHHVTANLVHAPASSAVRIWVGAFVLLLLVVVPVVLVLRANSGNPAADQLSALSVPSWAAGNPQTHTSGSRYCVGQCLVTERTWESTHSVDETAAAFATALRKDGWTPADSCPKFPGGVQTCWVLNQNELDLTVGKAPCAQAPPPSNRTGVIGEPPVDPAKPPAG
jgi:hypothetical protein